ncbi:hypothetical protein [Aneurinibacillus tyrosinisolvens]|uniref:hypothetical protein n=1 Tax=Aneurinibacillus tyrosinisolvens TaxID=1443435 RepID=UPI00063F3223|nr:hypothetical protein [Aneurinibacillus tyrosinisolvens]
MILGLSTTFITSQASAQTVFGVEWDENYKWGDLQYNGGTITPIQSEPQYTPVEEMVQEDVTPEERVVDFGIHEAKVVEYLTNVTLRTITDVRLSGKFANFKAGFARTIAAERAYLDRVLNNEQKGNLTEMVTDIQSNTDVNSPEVKALFNDRNFIVFKKNNVYSLVQARSVNRMTYVNFIDLGTTIVKFPNYSVDAKKKTISFVYNKQKKVIPFVLINDTAPQSRYVKLVDVQKAVGLKVQVNKNNDREYIVLSK